MQRYTLLVWGKNCAVRGCRERHGLAQEDFDLLLDFQGYARGMCRNPFEEGQLIHVDHDHACCQKKNRSYGEWGPTWSAGPGGCARRSPAAPGPPRKDDALGR